MTMGTKTLAEIKKELIARFGYLPDFSVKAMAARRRELPAPVNELNELEKSLSASLDALEREINKPQLGSCIMKITDKRIDVTYGQLEAVLRAYGFTCRPGNRTPPGRIYEHKKTGAIVALPSFPETDKVYAHHWMAARTELDNFGIADPTTFDAKIQKAG